jgi:hypothetical protein
MGNYLKQTPVFDIEFNVDENSLFILSNLQYNWLNDPYTTAWTEVEKVGLQKQINNLIWNNWNRPIRVQSNNKSFFSKNKNDKSTPVIFISQTVNNSPHWTIEVNKVQKGGFQQNYIQWSMQKILLSVEDSHESSNSISDTDSYWSTHKTEFSNANQLNTFGIGTIGMQLREKYLELLLNFINDKKNPLIAKTNFTLID